MLYGTGAVAFRAPPVAQGEVLSVTRLAAGTGSTLVSTGLPLRPGRLQPTALNMVRVFVQGAEKQIFIKALEGRYGDGSVRSILIQFTHTLTNGSPLAGELRFGQQRQTTDISETSTTNVAVPAGMALPTVAYLCAVPHAGWLRPESELAGTVPQDWLDLWAIYRPRHTTIYNTNGDPWHPPSAVGDLAYYEYQETTWQYWMMTGDLVMLDRALRLTHNFQQRLINTGGDVPGTFETKLNVKGLALRYWFTGDSNARLAIWQLGGQSAFFVEGPLGSTDYFWLQGTSGNDRLRARSWHNYIEAYMVNVSGSAPGAAYSNFLTTSLVNTFPNRVLGTQRRLGKNYPAGGGPVQADQDGLFGGYDLEWGGGPPGGGACAAGGPAWDTSHVIPKRQTGQKTFMAAQLCRTFLWHWWHRIPGYDDASFLDGLLAWCNMMWTYERYSGPSANEFEGGEIFTAFGYCSRCCGPAGAPEAGGDTAHRWHGHNTMCAFPYLWVWRMTNDTTHRDRADTLITELYLSGTAGEPSSTNGAFDYELGDPGSLAGVYVNQFDQAFTSFPNLLALRSGIALEPPVE